MSKLIPKEDRKIVVGSIVIFGLSILGFCTLCSVSSWISIITVDVYFIYVIVYAARKSDVYKPDNWKYGKWIPNRFSGLFVFLFLYLSAITAFAKILMQAGAPGYVLANGDNSNHLALYKSFISITSLDYDNYAAESLGLQESYGLQRLQMFQSFNGILLLTATFGFLIARISNFKEKITLESINNRLRKSKRYRRSKKY